MANKAEKNAVKDAVKNHINVADDTAERIPVCIPGSGACFVAGTLIHTIDGLKPIETIEQGDLIWSREEFGDDYDYRPVIAKKITANVPIYEVQIEHDNGLIETFGTTEEHPFWIDGLGWRKAAVLEAGMTLLDRHGKPTVKSHQPTA